MTTARGRISGPSLFLLVGDPLRWRLLHELTQSDCKVRELAETLGQAKGLVSYHLGRLRSAGLVSMRRSSADGRDTYYSVDLARCGELLAASAGALHPALKLEPIDLAITPSGPAGPPLRVLFLCTGNSARSQMAEALLDHLSCGATLSVSAGSHPKTLHRNAVRAMAEFGIDINGRRTKHLDDFIDQRFDVVVTLCDRLREICPEFPGAPRVMHWSIADPSDPDASDDESYPAFQEVARDLASRIRFLLFILPGFAAQTATPSTS